MGQSSGSSISAGYGKLLTILVLLVSFAATVWHDTPRHISRFSLSASAGGNSPLASSDKKSHVVGGFVLANR
jgi:hypothetical protein